MSLLELEHVSKRYKRGARERIALQDITLEIHTGEVVGVWGLRNSGRSTLLRIAAGIEQPDQGGVRFEGHDLSNHFPALGDRIGYCHPPLCGPAALRHGANSAPVITGLITAQLARGVPASIAKERAVQALERAEAQNCVHLYPGELEGAETVRIAIAQALTSSPALLVIDEPARGVDLLQRDRILALVRSLANEGIAILMSVGEGTGLFGADRALSLDEGELRGPASPTLAPVISLAQRLSA